MSVPYGLVFWGEQFISSGLSAVLFATLPFFVVVFAHIISDEKMTRVKAVGILASFAGLMAIFWRDFTTQTGAAHAVFLGGLAVVGSAASGGLANVVAKHYATKIDPPMNVLVQAFICAVVLSTLGLLTETGDRMNFTLISVGAILYLGIVGSALAFVGMYWLFTQTTATNVSLNTFITPILALVLGWLVLAEVPDLDVGLGAALILAGVYLTVKPNGRFA